MTRLLAAALGVIVASSAAGATAKLLFCPGMQQARLTCCCPEVEADRDVVRAPCCEAQATFTHDGVRADDGNPRIAAAQAAPLVAVVDVRGSEPLAGPRADRALHARAGPSTPLYARNSIYLL
jgi:hypothetical protein